MTTTKKTKSAEHSAQIFRNCNIVIITPVRELSSFKDALGILALPNRAGLSTYKEAEQSDKRFLATKLIEYSLGKEFATSPNIDALTINFLDFRYLESAVGYVNDLLPSLTTTDEGGNLRFAEPRRWRIRGYWHKSSFISKNTTAHKYKLNTFSEKLKSNHYFWYAEGIEGAVVERGNYA